MNELKRKLALWLCPELGEELKKVTDHNEWLDGNIKTLCEALGKANTRVEELRNELSETQYEVLQLTAKLHLQEKASKKERKYKLHKPRKV